MKKATIAGGLLAFAVLSGAGCAEEKEEQIQATAPRIMDTIPAELMNYAVMGQQYAEAVKAGLGRHLFGAIAERGTAGAVAFCNTRAIGITDSVAASLQVTVKRVSDQPRNPQNLANTMERAFIDALKQRVAKGESLSAGIREEAGTVTTYHPIQTNAGCLQCHGAPLTEILPGTDSMIRKLYPQDQARGYADKNVRGLFVVRMEKK